MNLFQSGTLYSLVSCLLYLNPCFNNEENRPNFQEIFKSDFDPAKKTMLYFHTRKKFNNRDVESLEKNFNLVIFDFLGYSKNYQHNLKNQLGRYTLEHLLQQSEIVLEDLEEELRKPQCYGSTYQRDKDLILIGRSLGTTVATKFAAKLEEEGKRSAGLINLVTPLNINVAVKATILRSLATIPATIKDLPKNLKYGFKKIHSDQLYRSSPTKKRLYIALNSISVVAILIGSYTYMLYIIIDSLAKIKTVSKSQIAQTSALVTLLVILPAFIAGLFFYEAKKVGITKEEIAKLKETPVTIIALENDIHSKMRYLTSYFNPKKENIHIYKVLNSSYLPKDFPKTENDNNEKDNNEKNIESLASPLPELQKEEKLLMQETSLPRLTNLIIKDKESYYNEKLKNPIIAHVAFSLQDIALEQIITSGQIKNKRA